MKEKAFVWLKKGLMWFGGIILFILIIGSIIPDEEAVEVSKIEEVPVGKKQGTEERNEVELVVEQELEKEVVQEKINPIVTIDSDEFNYLSVKKVNVWVSYENRTLVTKLDRKDEVELLSQDKENDYCQIKTGEAIGWISCGWISNLPK